MTSGAYMGIVGSYLILFGMIKEIEPLHWIGLILATIGWVIAVKREEFFEDRIVRLEEHERKPVKGVIIHKVGEEPCSK